ncbi:hypothetical protein [Paenibacillus taichungensis]|uniref:hypothetical protein n=1 Tax=Paenibacillus taichungensis TaxID=484184 RepID=UPI0039A61C56
MKFPKLKQIEIPFTEFLDIANQEVYAFDLVIRQFAQTKVPTLNPIVDYTTTVEGNNIVVNFLVDYTDEFSVEARDLRFIRANGSHASQSEVYTTTENDQVIDITT